MTRKTIILLALGLIITLGLVWIVGKKSDHQPKQQSTSYSAIQSEVNSKQAELIDVRTAEEYAEGHIQDATNFPLQQMQAGQFPEVSKTETIYVYCHSGNRSAQATQLLKANGFTNVVDLGSITAVQAMGGVVVK